MPAARAAHCNVWSRELSAGERCLATPMWTCSCFALLGLYACMPWTLNKVRFMRRVVHAWSFIRPTECKVEAATAPSSPRTESNRDIVHAHSTWHASSCLPSKQIAGSAHRCAGAYHYIYMCQQLGFLPSWLNDLWPGYVTWETHGMPGLAVSGLPAGATHNTQVGVISRTRPSLDVL